MHIFRAFVALCVFSEGEKEFFLASHAYTLVYTHTYVHAHLISPYPLFSSQKSSRVAPGSLPINFRLKTTPFIWPMKNRLVRAINAGFFLPKADKLVVQIFDFQLCFLHSVFEFVKPVNCLVVLNEPYYLFLKGFKGHAQGGGSFGDSLRIFRVKLNSLPMTDNPNTYHSCPLSYCPLVIR
nr:MAG TPA_asm: hypothetical protein [Caudoviricetes sp.]